MPELYASLSDDDRRQLNRLHEDVRAYVHQTLDVLKNQPESSLRRGALATVHTGVSLLFQSVGRPSYDHALAAGIIAPVACSKGCAACCYLSIETTILGAIAVAEALRDRRDNLKTALAETAAKVAGLSPRARAAQGVPCAFLYDNACQIYDVRPLACQSYFAFDRAACDADRLSGGVRGNVPVYGLPRVLNSIFTGGMCAACDDLGLQSCTVELTASVALILSDPTAVSKWLAGEHVFAAYTR